MNSPTCSEGSGGVHDAIRDRNPPIGRDGFEHGVDILPHRKRHQGQALAGALVEHLGAILRKVHDGNGRMVGAHLVARPIDLRVPAALDEHERIALEVIQRNKILMREVTLERHGAMQGLTRKLHARAAVFAQEGVVVHAHYDVYLAAEIAQHVARRLRVLKRNHLHAHTGAFLAHARPKPSQIRASVVVPIDKLSIVVTVAFSYFVFKEKLTRKSGAGLVLIVAGTLLMTLPAA